MVFKASNEPKRKTNKKKRQKLAPHLRLKIIGCEALRKGSKHFYKIRTHNVTPRGAGLANLYKGERTTLPNYTTGRVTGLNRALLKVVNTNKPYMSPATWFRGRYDPQLWCLLPGLELDCQFSKGWPSSEMKCLLDSVAVPAILFFQKGMGIRKIYAYMSQCSFSESSFINNQPHQLISHHIQVQPSSKPELTKLRWRQCPWLAVIWSPGPKVLQGDHSPTFMLFGIRCGALEVSATTVTNQIGP